MSDHRTRLETVWRRLMAVGVLLALLPLPVPAQSGRISATRHNLAAQGLSAREGRATGEVCGFCHAPHTAQGMAAIWARTDSAVHYRIYESSTLDTRPGQPTGTSKMCLSCHDGTIALGHTLPGRSGSNAKMPGSALANLGTDLSDDHPISFAYTSGLAVQDQQLADPSALSKETPLDKNANLQCTTCHNPHNNRWGNFLTKTDRNGDLCVECHRLDGWSSSTHRTSHSAVSGVVGGDWPYATVSQNACRSCHRPHGAKGHERLLIDDTEETNCLICHDGGVARTNIAAEIRKPNAHDPRRYLGIHDPAERPPVGTPHVECSDCHNPHAVSGEMAGQQGDTPLGATLHHVQGMSASGAAIRNAKNEYEVCFKCHGERMPGEDIPITRQVTATGLRAELSTSSESYHPVLRGLVRSDTVSLESSISKGSKIRCTDCHNSDASPRAGGRGPDGPHGSIYEHVLIRNYSTMDGSSESENSYALCYGCHRRTSILADESFPLHRKHIVDQKTPCSTCHDPHGVSSGTGGSHTHLINFDTSVVSKSASGEISFRDQGRFAGNCTLRCHGVDHDKLEYP